MKLSEIVLENKEKVILNYKRKECARCGKEVFDSMNCATERIIVELVGLAQWKVHKCRE